MTKRNVIPRNFTRIKAEQLTESSGGKPETGNEHIEGRASTCICLYDGRNKKHRPQLLRQRRHIRS